MQVDPDFSVTVIFYTRIAFIMKSIQSAAYHCVNLDHTKTKSKFEVIMY